jgi:predicted transglutaminase-like cysteine proteinase
LGAAASGVAASGGRSGDQARNALEFSETPPPIGYVKFCETNQTECARYSLSEVLTATLLSVTPAVWSELVAINTSVNKAVKPVSDSDLYGVPEYWTYPTNAGDCEDYLLEKKRLLEEAGLPANALRITVVLDENRQGHAVLTVTTTEGDYILDNRRDEIRLWSETGYTFLKRQSAHNPRHWVTLRDKAAPSAVSSGATQP